MPAIKCLSCARYSFAEGCSLERVNYYKFRDCMTGVRDQRYPAVCAAPWNQEQLPADLRRRQEAAK